MGIVGWNKLAAVSSAVVVGLVVMPQWGEAAAPPEKPAGGLTWVFGDIKHPLRGIDEKTDAQGRITEENYRAIIDGLKNNLHCNGLRIYIDPAIENPAKYPKIYQEVVAYAREQKLAIYANPFETLKLRQEKFGNDRVRFAEWVARYANHFRPEFLGPFNESGWSADDMVDIVARVRKRLDYSPQLVGPDKMHVRTSIDDLSKHRNLAALFDVVSSHNAAKDEEATAEAWRKLQQFAGKPTWATENPRPLSIKNARGQEIGIRAVLDSGAVRGLVIYLAYPSCVKDNGSLTEKGRVIEQGIAKP